MQALIDSDVLLYEIGFSSEGKSEETREIEPASWDFCKDLFDTKIALIQDEVRATEPPLLFMTNTHYINKQLNKTREFRKESIKEYVENFRFEAAKEKEYKGTRKPTKPFHFKNLVNYVLSSYNAIVNENGLEADDQMCIEQYTRFKQELYDTIICSRDKDVRQCPGWHYSWECGKQSSVGPIFVEPLGHLELKSSKKLFGTGDKFFYAQMIMGDSVDNVGGLKGRGPAFAYNRLKDCQSSLECYESVAELYVNFYESEWKPHFREQADLMWMIRELDTDGNKIKWKVPTNDV